MKECTNQEPTVVEYQSLDDIMRRREQLRKEIAVSNAHIKTLWGSLFKKPVAAATPGNRLRSVINVGAGALDGAILAWKLYRKYRK